MPSLQQLNLKLFPESFSRALLQLLLTLNNNLQKFVLDPRRRVLSVLDKEGEQLNRRSLCSELKWRVRNIRSCNGRVNTAKKKLVYRQNIQLK